MAAQAAIHDTHPHAIGKWQGDCRSTPSKIRRWAVVDGRLRGHDDRWGQRV